MVQIGIRGAISDAANYDFAKAAGVRIVFIEEFAERGAEDVMAEARQIVGDRPTYVSFDIDVLDPVDRARHRHAGDRRHHDPRGAGDRARARAASTSSAPISSRCRRRSIRPASPR